MFKKPNQKQNFFELEQEILKFWKEQKILDKSIELRSKEKSYTFYDGPITANGEPHTGHMLTFSLKDIFPRYWTMRGYRVDRSLGWDCHGIPVEYEIEKKLGFKEKKDIEKYGIKEFNQLCKDSVIKYQKNIVELEELMGRLTNSSEEYATMDNKFIESVWRSLKELYDKNLLYEGYKVVPYSTRAGTTLSNAEVALGGYKPFVDPAITVEFQLSEMPDKYILAWTTTPWTIPSNLGLAINPKIDYVEVKTTKTDVEIERVLLINQLPENLNTYKNEEIIQAYIDDYQDDSEIRFENVRVRKKGNNYTLTIKYLIGDGAHFGQHIEKTETITKQQFEEYLEKSSRVVYKTRYYYTLEDGTGSEIDLYHKHLEGLNIVEVEFINPYAARDFIKPSWFGEEVTNSKGIWPYWISVHTLEEAKLENAKNIEPEFLPESVLSEKTYIVAKERLSEVFKGRYFEVIRSIDPQTLLGKSYVPPFNFFVGRKNAHKIFSADYVSTESGTGIVHQAPYGTEDNEVFLREGIESFDVLDEQGDFTTQIANYAGQFYRQANINIIDD